MDKNIFRGEPRPEADTLRPQTPGNPLFAEPQFTRLPSEVQTSADNEPTAAEFVRRQVPRRLPIPSAALPDIPAQVLEPQAEEPRGAQSPEPPHHPDKVDLAKPEAPSTPPDPEPKDTRSPVQKMIGTTVRADTTLNERLTERLKDILPEGQTTVPPVRLHLRMGPHGHGGNFADLPDLLKREKAKVYCYEDTAGDAASGILTELAQAPIDNSDKKAVAEVLDPLATLGRPLRGSDTVEEKQVEAIVGTGIAIGHFDVKPNKGDANLNDANAAPEKKLTLYELGETLDDTLEIMREGAVDMADNFAERDTLMLGPTIAEDGSVTAGRFEDETVRILTENPELLLEPEIPVVDTHGSGHAGMFHRADAAGVTVKRSFAEMPNIYRTSVELIRKVAIGKEPTKAFLVKCFADEAIRVGIGHTVRTYEYADDSDVVRYVRTRAELFTEADAQKVFAAMKASPRAADRASAINEVLKEKGFAPLPNSMDMIRIDVAMRDGVSAIKAARAQAESDDRRAAA